MSLVEQKRLQWAREREEMAGLCAPWGPPPPCDAFRTHIRTHFVKAELRQVGGDAAAAQGKRPDPLGHVRRRSPSLPPIRGAGMGAGALTANALTDEDYHAATHERERERERERESEREREREREQEEGGETETSGYASEPGGNDPRQELFWRQQQQQQPQPQPSASPWHSEQSLRASRRQAPCSRGYNTPDSLVSTGSHRFSYDGTDEINRPRWGDRGVGVGHLWEPTFHEPGCRLPQVQGSDRDTPSWLERGLSKMGDSQVLVINHRPDPVSPPLMPRSLTNSYDNISTINSQYSDCRRTFLRGQNVPVEPDVLLERERKRLKALEIQNAIRQQLEERDRQRKEERERRAREEREEDMRIKREQERERQRLEEELSKQREKEEKEARKAKAMREALENAKKLAQEEKMRARAKFVPPDQHEEESGRTGPTTNPTKASGNHPSRTQAFVEDVKEEEIRTTSKAVVNQRSDIRDYTRIRKGKAVASEAAAAAAAAAEAAAVADAEAEAEAAEAEAGAAEAVARAAPRVEAVAEGVALLPMAAEGLQLALLMPAPALLLERGQLARLRHLQAARRGDAGRAGPRGRNARRSERDRDRDRDRDYADKTSSLDRPHRGSKLALRSRSHSQPNQAQAPLEERPKWGANRPAAQYVKQSDKDPYHQRRVRQRLLRAALLAELEGASGGRGRFPGARAPAGTATATESESSQRRAGSTERNSRSPSPLELSFGSSDKNTKYETQNFFEKSNFEKADVSVISLDLLSLNSTDKKIFTQGRQKERGKVRNFHFGSPSKRVQVLTLSQNSSRLQDNTSSKSKDISSPSFCTFPKTYSRSYRSRQTKQQCDTLDSKDDVDQYSSQNILSQLTSLRQGLLIKQQECETRKNLTPYMESFW